MKPNSNLNPVVSIIMPLFNGMKFVSEAIRSVQDQTFTCWELLIVDDGSTDESVSIVKSLLKHDSRIKIFLFSANKGPAAARNLALFHAKGRYIAFLDCDDIWLPMKLDAQINVLSTTGAPFCYGAYLRVDTCGNLLGYLGVPKELSYKDELYTNYVGCLTAIYDTYAYGKVDMIESLSCHEDYPLWLRLLRQQGPAIGVLFVIAKYRVNPKSLSSNKFKTSFQIWRIYREIEKLSFFMSLFYFINQSIRAIIRHFFPKIGIILGWLHQVEEFSDYNFNKENIPKNNKMY